MGYLTPENVPDNSACRALFIPNDPAYLAIVRGALQELTAPYNWEKYGALTPAQAAESFVDMFDKFCANIGACRVIGEIIMYGGVDSPDPNWLECDGSYVLQSEYPSLYSVIGDSYGAPIAGHFALPDFRGRAPSGVGAGTSLANVNLGDMYGEASHTLTTSEMPVHTHTNSPHVHSEGTAVSTIINGGLEAPASSAVPFPSTTGASGVSIDNAGGGGSHNNIGPRLGVTFLIVAKDG